MFYILIVGYGNPWRNQMTIEQITSHRDDFVQQLRDEVKGENDTREVLYYCERIAYWNGIIQGMIKYERKSA